MSDTFSFADSPPMAAPAESNGHQSQVSSPEGPSVNFVETIVIPTPNGAGASHAIGDPRRSGAAICHPDSSEVPEGGGASAASLPAGPSGTSSGARPSSGSTYPQAGGDGAAAGSEQGRDGDESSHSRIGAGVRGRLVESGSLELCHRGPLGETDNLVHTPTHTKEGCQPGWAVGGVGSCYVQSRTSAGCPVQGRHGRIQPEQDIFGIIATYYS